jgi:histidinol-phosphatase (PHP family)
MTLADNHNHILLARITQMLTAAKTNKISDFSITEHVSQFRELRESVRFGSVHPNGRIFESLKEYNDEFRKIDRGAYTGMKINRGLEVDFSPRFEKRVSDFVNQEEWDILLCSVHEFEDGRDIEKSLRGTVDPATANEQWLRYLRLERAALESDFVPFKVLSHPVRISRATRAVPVDLDDLLLDLARLARTRNKALELNGRDIDFAPDLVRGLAIACSKSGCRVSIGSDAHHPREVFRNVGKAMTLVKEFDLEVSQIS